MGEQTNAAFEEEKYQETLHSLLQAMGQLDERSQKQLQEKHGLSPQFKSGTWGVEQMLEMCDRAMATLSEQYVEHLAAYKETEDPLKCLHHLEESEVIWKGESLVIQYFDGGGEETAFLKEMRGMTLEVLEDRLERAAEVCQRDACAENVALVLCTLGVMDRVLEDLGHPEASPSRQKLKSIALGFRI